ncbi:MAG: hypothetical protein U0527_08160 [Candidatus Eisenbacteria bacterium]
MSEYQLRKNGLDGVGYRFKWTHIFYAVDLALIFGLFSWGGQWYFETKGVPAIQATEVERTRQQAEAKRLAAEADSVVAASRVLLVRAREDSIAAYAELQQRNQAIETGYAEIQAEQAKTVEIARPLYDLRQSAESNVSQAANYDQELTARESEIVRTDSTALAAEQKLEQAKQSLSASTNELETAHRTVTYEPHSRFPTSSGVMVRSEARDGAAMTGVELQHMMWQRSGTDVGLSFGLGLGSGSTESMKQLGLVFARPLVHRRLGLDFGAGYSLLTNDTGKDESSPYASASLRYAPFYKERFHLGLGARADQDGVQPFVGVALGRR